MKLYGPHTQRATLYSPLECNAVLTSVKESSAVLVKSGAASAIMTAPHEQRAALFGDLGEAPVCSVSPTTLDFGNVNVGEYSDDTFTIENTGGGFVAGTVSESCSHYSIVSGGGAFNLANGESVEVTIRFQPTSTGTKNCTIETGLATCSDVSCTGVGVSAFNFSNMVITVGQSSIRFQYDTSESADCKFFERIEGMPFWIPKNNWTYPHGTEHDHILSGYGDGYIRHFQIQIRNAAEDVIYAPGPTNLYYYYVTFGEGGGYEVRADEE